VAEYQISRHTRPYADSEAAVVMTCSGMGSRFCPRSLLAAASKVRRIANGGLDLAKLASTAQTLVRPSSHPRPCRDSNRSGRLPGPDQGCDCRQAFCAIQRKGVPSRHIRCMMTASLRATATFAFLSELRFASV